MARTHGKPSTYNNARCRCDACRAGIAAYRASRRANGHDLKPKKSNAKEAAA